MKVLFFSYSPLRRLTNFALTSPEWFKTPAWVVSLSDGAPAWVFSLSGVAPAWVFSLNGVTPAWVVILISVSSECHPRPLAT